MSHSVPLWLFGQSVAQERAQQLLSYANFDAVAQLLHDATITDFAWEPFTRKQLKGCRRASFLLRVSPNAYDAFFNSPVGYRAQYAIAPSKGEVANRRLLSSLEERLLAFAHAHSHQSGSLVLASLRATEAKLWICEVEVEGQLGVADEPAILYPPWLQTSIDAVGLLAPRGQELEVKGGWFDQQGNERTNPAKATRSEDIHRTGFS